MSIRRWRPFNDLLRLQKEMDSMFDEFFERKPFRRELGESDWYPSVDVSEDEKEIKIEADLPGMTQEDIDINIDGNVLTIKGQRKKEEETKERGYYRSERSYGAFQRSFTLPTNLDVDEAKANFKHGVLTLILPKLEEAKGKRIEIEVE